MATIASVRGDLTDADEVLDLSRRFGGLERLYGITGAQIIRASHVAIVGIGGVGSWAAEALARSGVGRLTLVDMDHVAESNINRQVHADSSTLGVAKIQAMRERIERINPECRVAAIDDFVTAANWPDVIPEVETVDAVIDACDQIGPKLAMAIWGRRTKQTLLVCVGAAGGKRLAHAIDLQDLAHVTHDPLLSRMRYQLRKTHGAPSGAKKIGVPCIYSKEPVASVHASCEMTGDGSLNCHGYGSVVTVTSAFGMAAAGYVLNELATRELQLLKK